MEKIQNWIFQTFIGDGSQFLYGATRKLAYIANVKILVPTNWNYEGATSTNEIAYEAKTKSAILATTE